MTLSTFQAAKTYTCRSVCDHDCVWSFEVVRRTAKSIWIKNSDGDIERKAISEYSGSEMVFPLGRFSMAPILRAENAA